MAANDDREYSVEGWYDDDGHFHRRFSESGFDEGRYASGINDRVVFNFGTEERPDYKEFYPAEWDYTDWDDFVEQVYDWMAREYGEATG